MSINPRWFNSSLNVWRESVTADGAGGQTVSYVDQGAVACKIDQSTPQEQLVAAQSGATHSHNIYVDPDDDVRRTDRLAASGVDPNDELPYYTVDATVTPSTPRYTKLICERRESGP